MSLRIWFIFSTMISGLACQDSTFHNQLTADRSDQEYQVLDEEETASEPVMIGGAFLFCAPGELGEVAMAVNCRLQTEDAIVPVSQEQVPDFYAVDDLETIHLLEYQWDLRSGEWHWNVQVPLNAGIRKLLLKLPLGSLAEEFRFILPEDWLVPEVPAGQESSIIAEPEMEADEIGDAGVELSDAIDNGPFMLKLGNSEFFLVGDGALLRQANPDCSDNVFDVVLDILDMNGANSELSFQVEIMENDTILTIDIPQLCGISSRTDLGQNLAIVDLPDGRRIEVPIPPQANRLAVLTNEKLTAGVLTLTIRSVAVAIANDLDDYVFWQPVLSANRQIRAVTP